MCALIFDNSATPYTTTTFIAKWKAIADAIDPSTGVSRILLNGAFKVDNKIIIAAYGGYSNVLEGYYMVGISTNGEYVTTGALTATQIANMFAEFWDGVNRIN